MRTVSVPASTAGSRDTGAERVAPAAVVAAVAGDMAARDDVVREYLPVVRRWAYGMTGCRVEADDLAQDVMIKALHNMDRVQPVAFESWLYRVTNNLFLDRVRRSRRIVFQALPEDADFLFPDRLAPDLLLDESSFDADVAAALAELRPDQREVLVMRDVYEMTYDDIALLLGVRPGTVRSRIHRARNRLRDLLAHRHPEAAAA